MKKLALIIMVLLVYPAAWAADEYDVVIYGGTSAGVAAAVQVSQTARKASIELLWRQSLNGDLRSAGKRVVNSGFDYLAPEQAHPIRVGLR